MVLEKFPTRVTTVHNHYVETADGQRHLISGVVYLPILPEGRTKDLQVLVLPNLEQTLILGVDFWNAMHIITDVHRRTWQFYKITGQLCSLNVKEGIVSKNNLLKEQAER